MTTCGHCGTLIVAGERMVAHMDDGPMWDAQGVLVTPQPMNYTPYYERCFKTMGESEQPSPSGPEETR